MKEFDLNCLNLSAHFRDRDKKISSNDLKDLDVYIFGYDPKDRETLEVNKGEYVILWGACAVHGLSNRLKGRSCILDEGQNKNPKNHYEKIDNFDKENFIEMTKDGWFITTPERSIIDCIRYNYCSDEEFLIAIEDYLEVYESPRGLYRVAEFYKVSKDVITHYIRMSRTLREGGLSND